MATLPWTVPQPPPPGARALVMASRFEVHSAAHVPRFLVKSLLAWKQVRSTPGAYGVSLVAQPWKRTFWTLSAWESDEALRAYATTEPHRSIMTGLGPVMKDALFVRWEVATDDLPVTWEEARHRLARR
ncbi:DUF3291 domain-containing protein [Streptomyces alkaliphilus]|nr:DUF3291 domain-containing protein [Streptomyces alkaliphilus]